MEGSGSAVRLTAPDYTTAPAAPEGFSGAAAAAFAPRLGAATFISVTIAGQVPVSVLPDHFGAVGFAERPVTPLRLLGALLLVAGVLMVRKF
ncbi:MAG: DMT family transporter [Pyrinomonadaceae bacterium]